MPGNAEQSSAPLLFHNPMLLSQPVRCGLPLPDSRLGQVPNPPLSPSRLRSGGFLEQLKNRGIYHKIGHLRFSQMAGMDSIT